MPEGNKQLVRRYFNEFLNDRRLGLSHEIVAHAYIEHAAAPFNDSVPGDVNGPEATAASARWLLEQFPDLHFTIESVIAEGDLIAARVLGEGTNLGCIGPIPPTGKRFTSRSTHWFRVADGRLAEHWATRDDLTTMRQLGVVGTPPIR